MILTRTRTYHHITLIWKDLYWLPLRQRVIFKMVTLTCHCLNGLAPLCLSQLLVPYSPSRPLRSSDSTCLRNLGLKQNHMATGHLWMQLLDIGTSYIIPFDKVIHRFLLNLALKKVVQESFKHKWTFWISVLYKCVYYIIISYCLNGRPIKKSDSL